MPAAVIKTDSPFWRLPLTALLEQLAASPDGLSSAEAALRLAQFGPNLIHEERKRALILQFLAKFRNPLVIILLTASALSAFTGDASAFFIIGTIVLMSVTLDFVQEYRAGQAAERLRHSVLVRGQVLRDGKLLEIPLAEMVPGDVALLAAGDLVPCDGRVLEAKDFFVNQALLTGEAFPVEKSPVELPTETEVLAAGNTVLLGTSVISGTAKVLMCRTGQNTELGEIADTLLAKAPPTAFEQGTHQFGLLIMRLTVLLVLFVLLVNAFFHRPWLESFLVVKGAPEDILRLSVSYEADEDVGLHPLDDAARVNINAQFEALSKEGFRVLGIASRQVGMDHPHAVVSDESELVFAGFAAFLDPPKGSAKAALAGLAADRVAVKIITGDNELVTQHIFAQLGLLVTGVLTGAEILELDDLALAARVEQVNLFCRVAPAQKNRVILALKRRGHVVGYLGDGINDAPSLHSADVGISVDSAVDVAKAAADMILLEHDLGVLHAGVLEGRRTFGNIMMGTSSNFGNMFSMAGASLFLPFLPMLPVQILLNNLLYDVSELPIPLDRVDDDYLTHPRHWDMTFIRNFMLIIGSVSSVFDFLTFYVMLAVFHAGEALFHTGWFIESMATQVLVIFIIRTRKNPFKSRPNPWLIACSLTVVAVAVVLPFTPAGVHLGFVAPPALLFLILIVMLLAYLLAAEAIKKWFFSRFAAE